MDRHTTKENLGEHMQEAKHKKNSAKTIIAKIILILISLFFTGIISMNLFMKINDFNTIISCSKKFGTDPAMIASIIHAESKFDQYAVSNKDAYGLMQITYDTFEFIKDKLGIDNVDFSQITLKNVNITAGTYYYSYLLEQFNGNVENALCAYNAGPTNVHNWLDNPEYSSDGQTLNVIPFPETENYVKKIKKVYHLYKFMLYFKI